MTRISKQAYTEYAAVMWQHLNDSERHGINFGLFPAQPMQAAEAIGYDGRELCLALMAIAKRN